MVPAVLIYTVIIQFLQLQFNNGNVGRALSCFHISKRLYGRDFSLSLTLLSKLLERPHPEMLGMVREPRAIPRSASSHAVSGIKLRASHMLGICSDTLSSQSQGNKSEINWD